MAFEKVTAATLGEWCRQQGHFRKNYLLYSGRSDGKTVKVHCTACESEWVARRAWLEDIEPCSYALPEQCGFYDDEGYVEIDGLEGICPVCREVGLVKWLGRLRGKRVRNFRHDEVSTLWVDSWEGKVRLRGWWVFREFDQQGREYFRCQMVEQYIIERSGEGTLKMERYSPTQDVVREYDDGSLMVKRGRCQDKWGKTDPRLIRLENLDGTLVENAHLKEYLDAAGEGIDIYPVTYLRLWLWRPRVECLLTAGAGWLLCQMMEDEIRERYNWTGGCPWLADIDWKKKRPGEMLGIDRAGLRLLRTETWNVQELKMYRLAVEGRLPWEEIRPLCKQITKRYTNEIARRPERGRILRYLKKQRQPAGDAWELLRDSWDMAKKLKMDLDDDQVKWPKDLQRWHDRLADMQQAENDRKLQKGFDKLAQRFEKAAAEKDGICIRIARSPAELREEGSRLRHCVGTYSENHLYGDCIFFVRKADAPDEPWYTLQEYTRTGHRLQLHGYRNDKDAPIPQEVKAFCDWWEKEVLKPLLAKEKKGVKRNGRTDSIAQKAG